MKEKIYRLLIELTNGRWSSGLLYKFSNSKASRRLIRSFAKTYKINTEEMERPLHEYISLHDFFTRALREGVRPIDEEMESVISPVDAVLEDSGTINTDSTFRVKGKTYSIEEMLGDRQASLKYLEGMYMVLYLSPSHYHRIHAPVAGEITRTCTLGTKSYPVNKWGMTMGKEPLSKNYREITEISHKNGHVAVVKVGAMFVNSIVRTHKGDNLKKGDEIGYFSFGSTVVLLFEKNSFHASIMGDLPVPVSMGQVIGVLGKG